MHEWALAEGLISAASRIAKEERLQDVTDVTISIGELQQVDHEILNFALEQQRTSIMAKAKFILETIPVTLLCRVCGEKRKLRPEMLGEEISEAIHFVPEMAHVYLKCPKCEKDSSR